MDKVTLPPLITELKNENAREILAESRMLNWHFTQPHHYTDGENETQRRDLSEVDPSGKSWSKLEALGRLTRPSSTTMVST